MVSKAGPTDEKTVRYLLSVIKSCADFQPDFAKVAEDFDINTSRPRADAQRRFKSIVEKAGFTLENGRHVTGGTPIRQDGLTTTNTTTKGGSIPQKPEKSRKKAAPGSSSKRRKSNKGNAVVAEAAGEDEDATSGKEDTLAGQDAEDVNVESA